MVSMLEKVSKAIKTVLWAIGCKPLIIGISAAFHLFLLQIARLFVLFVLRY